MTFKIEKKVKFFIPIYLIAFLILSLNPVLAVENIFQRTSGGLANTREAAGLPQNEFTLSLMTVVNILLSFIGIFFLFLIIYGGYLWMTAAGNEEQVGKAKKIIIASVIGVTIILVARIITEFVISEILGKSIT